MTLSPVPGAAKSPVHRWNGVAMGAEATIQLIHPDANEANRVIALAIAEIARLEDIFSLYRPDSSVSRLNRHGRLIAPPLELVDLLTRAAAVSAMSGGAFDMTVQPLWARYRDHFSADPGATALPAVDDILPLVDWRAVRSDGEAIAFDRPGMAITPNGIAQGYVTDRVADLLRRNHIDAVALNLGEVLTMGHRGDGRDWQVGITDPEEPARIAGRIACSDRAVATSGGYGTIFDSSRRYSHLLDPRTGKTAPIERGVSVVADSACLADAWSTAFALMDSASIRASAHGLENIEVYVATPDAGLERLA
ncbi:FAD:protein FMN transferase [Methyloceanibacter sp.]|uniref:FAD:protein FMN transferase n=1 Tax=Methyloceanibacter sp. TaxID=1965321 RepID=UPI002BD7C40B|nr:FAD:protein FMN transferase [Methyloceanibacter sp.]HML92927.1 FAD:protein FMN transferase [Methyloceanibacter sp.]